MKAKPLNAHRLDVQAFIRDAGELQGQAPLRSFARLCEGLMAVDGTSAQEPLPVRWAVSGRTLVQRYAGDQLWLDVQAQADVTMPCQRCLQGVQAHVHVQRSLRFVADEAQAQALDAESEDDVLAVSRSFDVLALIEDELIMALPLVPRHERCPQTHPALLGERVGGEGSEDDELVYPPQVQQAFDATASGRDEEAGRAAQRTQSPDPASQGAQGVSGGKPHPFAVLAALKRKPGDGAGGASEG